MPTIKKRGFASKKQQPQPEIAAITNTISDFFEENRKIFIVAASALAAVLVFAVVFSLNRSGREEKAGPMFAAAYDAYVSGPAGTADYAKALELFRDVNKKYPSTKSGSVAQYYIGNSLMEMGRNEEALVEYELFVKRHGRDKFLLSLVYQRMGYLYQEMGKQTEAIKAFEKSESLRGPGVSTVELAKLYEAAGNETEARNKYKAISDKLAGTKFAMEATGKVEKISSAPSSTQKGSK